MASLKDLNEVKASMEGLLNFRDMCDDHPVGLIAMNGHLKLMELLFHTDFDFHQKRFLQSLQGSLRRRQHRNCEIDGQFIQRIWY